MRNWLLPENIEDILPPEASRIESLRTKLLAMFRVHGYELVIPPLLEYLESLLTGTGEDLGLRTFKLMDQVSGRMMGVRADITPQVARIDAHLLNRIGVARLCYCGSVLHTRTRDLHGTREPIQIGAEIYGHAGIEGDLEVQRLLLECLSTCGLGKAKLDLSHVAVFRTLCRRGKVSAVLESELHAALDAKDTPQLENLTSKLPSQTRVALRLLPDLYGDRAILVKARKFLPLYPEISAALDDLDRLARDPKLPATIDLADLRGYHYHSGVVFSVYMPGEPNAIALGGRYDEVGKAFGRARPATGFSMDLRHLARIAVISESNGAILAPCLDNSKLATAIEKLRQKGEVVITDLPGHAGAGRELRCNRKLVLIGGKWQVRTN
jgi:ATP phosphoribosyltransferase regulatory subunit